MYLVTAQFAFENSCLVQYQTEYTTIKIHLYQDGDILKCIWYTGPMADSFWIKKNLCSVIFYKK
jgi:hypothetical protein